MSDTIAVLQHSTNPLAKTWKADGTITAYGDAKFFTLTQSPVDNLAELSALLTKVEKQPKTCIIRGAYVGDEVAQQRDPGFQRGKVRRALDYFGDQPLHATLIDVDKFEPLCADALIDPQGAIDEFIFTMLPEPFHGAGYHWQLSNSAGHHSKGTELRAHLWFWLDTPLTSAQLKAWAKAVDLNADLALFNPVQVHYTALPIMEPGQVDPYPTRSGYVAGLFGDEVVLDIDQAVLSAAVVSAGGRGQRLLDVVSEDPIAQVLYEKQLVKSQRREGGLNIECPFSDEHTGESVETATVYYPPNTGGYAVGHFKCLHSHCASRSRGQFLARLGIEDIAKEFEAFDTPALSDTYTDKVERKGIPEAKHLTTDQANAGRIVSKFGKRLIVVAGQWHAWSGNRWEKDDGEVYRYACRLSKIIHAEADAWLARPAASAEEKERNAKIAEALAKWAQKSEMKSAIEAAVGLAKKMLTVSEDMIDRNPWLLNCLNGTVDLRTGELRKHTPEDFITKLVELNYTAEADAPLWRGVLAKVTLEEGATKPLASFLQRWFGYCCTGSTREQQFVVHYGSGSNGKSTILDTVADILGSYAGTAAPGLMVSNAKDRHPTEIADLFGRRMVTAHEANEGGQLREDFVKQATGGDKIKARFMRGDFFEFDPTHKLQLLTNHKPIIKGQDNGIWRRVLLFPYAARFSGAEDVTAGRAHWVKDTKIVERLRGEAEGILAWLVEGAQAWFQDGLQPPDAVLAASRDYQSEQDRIGQFVSECCVLGKDFETPISGEFGGIYDVYRAWCGDNGTFALSKIRLVQELERCVPYFAKKETKQVGHAGKRRKVLVICGLQMLES